MHDSTSPNTDNIATDNIAQIQTGKSVLLMAHVHGLYLADDCL